MLLSSKSDKRVEAHKIISSVFFFTVKLQTGKSVTRVAYGEHCTEVAISLF